eukprot:36620-Eustigmatos_ZCMA.PRE.1
MRGVSGVGGQGGGLHGRRLHLDSAHVSRTVGRRGDLAERHEIEVSAKMRYGTTRQMLQQVCVNKHRCISQKNSDL